MPENNKCPSCGATLPADLPAGLCAACLLAAGSPAAEPGEVARRSTIHLSLPPLAEELGEKPGNRIGRYKLLERIGEGGMGTVWMAERTENYRQKVALKIIKPGLDTKEVLARFERERQALAAMDHPNIAKVLDAGATETGRPFFVMELVQGKATANRPDPKESCGIPITRYCDENKLKTKQRVELFIQVCQAIQHAHQKGIIHRDIKPSNVLVADYDGVPVPKIIDFGILKHTGGQQWADKTTVTALGQIIGTPAYMSPEQAEMNAMDIDTRTDIYSLGVLLYELLTGKTPFDAGKLLKAGFDEIRRVIREEEPPWPSKKLSTLVAEEQTTTAKSRQTDPSRLIHLVRGDLDQIVMKTLEKDRNRRYETANGLAMDIQRHLRNEPVVARPPSNLYRFQKMVRRNKLAFGAASAVSLALIAGVAVSTWQAIRATKAERRTQTVMSEIYFGMVRGLAQYELPNVSVTRDKSRGGNATVLYPYQSASTTNAAARQMIDEAVKRLNSANLHDVPEEDAQTKVLLALMYMQNGEFAKAEPLLRESLALQKKMLGASDPAIVTILDWLGFVLMFRGDWPGAESEFQEALAVQKKAIGDSRPEIVNSLNLIGMAREGRDDLPGAEAMFREALSIARKIQLKDPSKDIPAQGSVMLNLAEVLRARKALGEARSLAEEAVAFYQRRPNSPEAQDVKQFLLLGKVLDDSQDYPAALIWYRKAADQGNSQAQNNLGWLYKTGLGVEINYAEAARLFRKSADQGNADGQDNIGVMYRDGLCVTNDNVEAVKWFRKAAEQGDADGQVNLGVMYRDGLGITNDNVEAVRWFRKAVEQGNAQGQACLGSMFWNGSGVEKNSSEAVKWYRKAADQDNAYGEFNLGWMYQNGDGISKDQAEAVKWYRKAAEQGNSQAQNNLGWLYKTGLGVETNLAEAVRLFRESADQGNAYGQYNLGWMYQNGWGVPRDHGEAIRWFRKTFDQRDADGVNQIAWWLATSVDPESRDGTNAVIFGEKAVELTKRTDGACLDTLAAAYAETGQFGKAVSVEKEAINLLTNEDTKITYMSHLKLYESGSAYHAK